MQRTIVGDVAPCLLLRLDGVVGKGPRWRAICPAHASKHKTRSLSILDDGGTILLRCHAGCDLHEITRALSIDASDLFPDHKRYDAASHRRRPKGRPWRAADVLDALRYELHVVWVVLADVAAGREVPEADRVRAGVARERCIALIHELTNAH